MTGSEDKDKGKRVKDKRGQEGDSDAAFVMRHATLATGYGSPVTVILLTVVLLALYITTLARGLILGDPTEYTYVAYLLGIAHPPGYAFITVLGKLIQTVIPVGTIAFRSHLLSAIVGSVAALAVFGVSKRVMEIFSDRRSIWIPLFVALSAAFGANVWQHSIHANPHIITATFFVVNIYLLLKWGERQGARGNRREQASFPFILSPLSLFCLSTGLGVVHHPLTAFAFPGYTLYILLTKPEILRDWQTLLKMIGVATLGLSLFFYYPIVSSTEPVVGPHTMNTWQGFLDHVLARGLTESLPFYTFAEQRIRFLVFWSIMRIQFTLPVVLLAFFGFGRLIWGLFRRIERSTAVLLLGTFLPLYGFVISLKQQDIMAYLLGPLLLCAVFAGIGLQQLASLRTHSGLPNVIRINRKVIPLTNAQAFLLYVALGFVFGPIWGLAQNYQRISLANFDEGDRHVAAVFAYFEDESEPVVLLNDWEFMTPLWYTRYVEGRTPDPNVVRPEFVSAAEPWLPSVFNYLPGGPVYINSYRREIVDAGFRLRPAGPFYQVVEPGDSSLPAELTAVSAMGEGIELVGYALPQPEVTAGDFVPLVLAMRVPAQTADFFAPVVTVGDIEFPFTTDTHLITPLWQAGEIIIERFDFALPHELAGGDYPMSVTIKNLSQNRDSGLSVPIGSLAVTALERSPSQNPQTLIFHFEPGLANFRQRVELRAATVRGPQTPERHEAPYKEPVTARPGEIVHIRLWWEVLDYAEESYTVFVHLIDQSNRSYTELDYTPLGGATPSHLWFPKWLPGQTMVDPYRMVIPADLPAGDYAIEVGLYEMRSGRRLHMHDAAGNLVGDRYILGPIKIEE